MKEGLKRTIEYYKQAISELSPPTTSQGRDIISLKAIKIMIAASNAMIDEIIKMDTGELIIIDKRRIESFKKPKDFKF